MYDLARSHSVCFPELDVNVSNGETRTTAITRLQNEGFVTRVRYWENKNKCIHFKRSKAPFLFCPECWLVHFCSLVCISCAWGWWEKNKKRGETKKCDKTQALNCSFCWKWHERSQRRAQRAMRSWRTLKQGRRDSNPQSSMGRFSILWKRPLSFARSGKGRKK